MKPLESDFGNSDYITSKFVDLLVECESLEEMLALMKSYREQYSKEFDNRKAWRSKINDLEKN